MTEEIGVSIDKAANGRRRVTDSFFSSRAFDRPCPSFL